MTTLLDTVIGCVSSVVQSFCIYIESFELYGYTVKDLPVFPRILKSVHILTAHGDLNNEVRNLRFANAQLHGAIDDLKTVNNKLSNEIEQFRKLKDSLQRFGEKQNKDFNRILSDVNGQFDRMNNLLHENERVLMMKVAQDVEFLDRNEGLSKTEYQRFVMRIPQRVKVKYETLVQQPQYKDMLAVFDEDENATISPQVIQQLIDELFQDQN
eukprot:CAMPEP_0202691202 /NCGR_PEP_ID=MMETSP1385-20130828/5985_1 /ASSEMBLY_ACC=CAM_ASM_000861 /TAXON_ID=933848 /ORGANISM="Elphidium margaritaceum" /LENGTH=211 /DNA_ID=CAMNT_0049346569 /DNA_START=29 /DNA_END=664 /DNA_ORIENTATION=-